MYVSPSVSVPVLKTLSLYMYVSQLHSQDMIYWHVRICLFTLGMYLCMCMYAIYMYMHVFMA